MRQALLLLALCGCPAVLVEPGNDFPCDFSKPPGARDAVCSPGDVCGVNNRCQRYQYEGPQFEGLPTFPQFTPEVGAGTVLHPRAITGPIDTVAKYVARDRVLVRSSARLFSVGFDGVRPEPSPDALARSDSDSWVVLPRVDSDEDAGSWSLVVTRESSQRGLLFVRPDGAVLRPAGMLAMSPVDTLRLIPPEPPSQPAFTRVVVTTGERVWLVSLDGGVTEYLATTPETVLDVAPGPRVLRRDPVVLTRTALWVRQPDGGALAVAVLDDPLRPNEGARLTTDETNGVYAILSRAPPRLRAFAIGPDFELRPAWDDCTPCLEPRLATPGLDGLGPFVDVLCDQSVRRIRGASASQGQCLEEPLEQPFQARLLSQPGNRPVFDTGSPFGFIGGGTAGQVWVGKTLGTAIPWFLDRVPLDVAQVGLPDGGSPVFALTTAGLFDGRPDRGYLVVAPDITSRVVALVNDGQGWVVGEAGNLVKVVNVGGRSLRALFGPRLVDGRGQPVTRPLRGEAFVGLDGGLVSMLIAADDSLFFLPTPEPQMAAGQLGDVSPVLTPEPSSFIRSLALERTPIGSNGVDRMRGYVVTSRSVFEVKLGGAPLRWTSTPLAFSGAEPVEVWFDNPRGGLARVGYRDGTVFSIPGGFQLTEPLPQADGGAPVAVLDYENLGGWPVALTDDGLFVARYDALPSGRLDSRFPDGGVNKPMTWREVTLPDGSRPWSDRSRPRFGAQPAKLFVLAEPTTTFTVDGGTASQRVFRLVVYLPTQVIEVGRHVRSNISAL
jgi:hypothetical protein